MKKFFAIIRQSLNGNTNDPSTIRIQSYLVLAPIILMVITFLVIEIFSFIHAVKIGTEYRLSNEVIVVFGMILSHHLALLFSRNKSQSVAELTGASKPFVETTPTETTTETTSTETTQVNS